ncbi:MAG: amino acid adenylation domain-containing protein [Acidimicrobiia bacterium]
MTDRLHLLLEKSADEHPERTAVLDRERSVTYRDLDLGANRIAQMLRSNGVVPGDRVGIYLDKSLEAVMGIYGVLKAGGVYVPLDARAPVARLAYIAADCGIEVLISSGKQAQQISELKKLGAPLRMIVNVGEAAPADISGVDVLNFAASEVSDRLNLPGNGMDLAYILYTSGSTGDPKGVMLSHLNGLAFVRWGIAELGIGPEDRLSSHAPFHFDLSIFDLFAASGSGSAIVLVPTATSVFPVEIARFIRQNEISVWYSVPSILSLLVQHGNLEDGDLPSLRAVVFAGEVFPSKFLAQLMKKLPQASFHNWYGPTETNVCTAYPVDTVPDPGGSDIPIGKAITGVETLVVNEDGSSTTAGEEGELLVRGPTVMAGYWGDPAKTAAKLVDDPEHPASKLYKTGDLVVEEPDGNYRFRGRRDHQIKSRGYRIELGEIETALNAHPDVVECVVVAIPDEVISNRIEAHVVLTGEQETSRLIKWCAGRVPRYMIPESFRIATALPKTSTGKIDRQAVQTSDSKELEP